MVLLYFMDGVKYDMMKECMPFLSSMHSVPLQSDFGYSCACHATMYTGRFIEEHGTWFIWKRGEHSPYKWLNYIPGLKYINFLPLKLFIGKLTNKLSNNSSYSGVPCLVNLPLKYWPLFELSDDVMWNDPKWKAHMPNLFTILQSHGIPHHIVALHNKTKANDSFIEEQQVDYSHNDFVYYFIGYTDNMMHSHGEDGEKVRAYFREVDAFIQTTYEKAKTMREDVTLIAFSDHGHIDIEKPLIDLDTYFRCSGNCVNNYIHLIESNYARFWFRNEVEYQEVSAVLQQLVNDGLGFIMDESYKLKYHLNLDPQEQGELIFYLAAPREFTNTIWGFGKTVKSGHGFEPTIPKHYGFFCSNKKLAENCEFARLVDVLPTVMEQTGIQKNSYVLRGKALIEKTPKD